MRRSISKALLIATCLVATGIQAENTSPTLVDPDATAETQALYRNLRELAKTKTLFGHQSSLAYGYNWYGEEGRSDVKSVTGSFPAIYGWDVGGMEIEGSSGHLESRYEYGWEDMIRWAKEVYARGGVITYAWHMRNPVTGGPYNDKTPAMATLLPGGENHASYLRTLDRLADFFKSHGEVPLIFRPWHEHNGDWFWWGKGLVSEEDYIAVWRLTVERLRDEKGVHNLIYAFSPDRSRMDLKQGAEAYLYAYPGDDYVDILGFDNYWDVGHPGNELPETVRLQNFIDSLEALVTIANKKGKIAALTETGLDRQEDPVWWTQMLLAGLNRNETTRQIAYLQVWRNANRELEGHDHFFTPYEGHPAAADFVKFKNDETILFEDELPDLYDKRKRE